MTRWKRSALLWVLMRERWTVANAALQDPSEQLAPRSFRRSPGLIAAGVGRVDNCCLSMDWASDKVDIMRLASIQRQWRRLSCHER